MTNLHIPVVSTFPTHPSPFESVVRRCSQIGRTDQTGPIYMETRPDFCRRLWQKVPKPLSLGNLYRRTTTEEIRITQGRGRLVVAHVNQVGKLLVEPAVFNVDHTSIITLAPLTPYRLDVGSGAIVEVISSVSYAELVLDQIPFEFSEEFEAA